MQQPELGRKIAELRKSKGLTQEELVAKCNLNVRTLQRIESGEVIPRSYTLKAISEVLDYEFYGSVKQTQDNLKRFAGYVMAIFNFKKDTMKKVNIISTSFLLIFLGACMFNFINDKNNESKIKKHIELQNKNSIEWFNSGQIDKLIADYALNACFYRNGHPVYCGKEEICRVMQLAVSAKAFKLFDIQLISLSVDGDLAVEKSLTSSTLQTGEIIKTINIQEWHNIDNKWLIVNDIDVLIMNK